MTKHLRPPVPPKAPTGPTAPDKEGRLEVPLHASESIVSLLVVGTGEELKLPPKNVFRAGRGSGVDVRIPDISGRALVSREHVEITRQGSEDGTWLQIVDLGSMHGTSFQKGRERDFPARAGERFRIADVELMPLDKPLQRLRHALGGFFGYSNHRVIDDHLVVLGTSEEPIVLIGPRGSERGHLAKAIHDNSRRRGKNFVVVKKAKADRPTLHPDFEAAKHGTLFVSLDGLGPRAAIGPLVSLMFDPDETYDVRPIIAARDVTVVSDAFAHVKSCLRHVTLPSVAAFRADVPALIDTMLEELASPHRVAELARDRVAALAAYDWNPAAPAVPNRADVRLAARRLHAYLEHGRNMTAAASWLKEDYETYRKGLKRVGIRRDD